jgi:hypothetical protein
MKVAPKDLSPNSGSTTGCRILGKVVTVFVVVVVVVVAVNTHIFC